MPPHPSQRGTDPEAAARRAHAKRSCRTWTDADGVTGHLHLSGPVRRMARVDNAIRHRADKPLPRRPGRGPPRTVGGLRLRRRHRAAHHPPVTASRCRRGGRQDHRPHRPRALAGAAAVEGETLRDRRDRARPRRHCAGVDGRRLRRRRAHQGRGRPACGPPGPAVQSHPAHRAAVAGPGLCPQGCANRLGLDTTTSKTGPTPTPPAWKPPSGSATPATSSNPAAGAVRTRCRRRMHLHPTRPQAVADAAAAVRRPRRNAARPPDPLPRFPTPGRARSGAGSAPARTRHAVSRRLQAGRSRGDDSHGT